MTVILNEYHDATNLYKSIIRTKKILRYSWVLREDPKRRVPTQDLGFFSNQIFSTAIFPAPKERIILPL